MVCRLQGLILYRLASQGFPSAIALTLSTTARIYRLSVPTGVLPVISAINAPAAHAEPLTPTPFRSTVHRVICKAARFKFPIH